MKGEFQATTRRSQTRPSKGFLILIESITEHGDIGGNIKQTAEFIKAWTKSGYQVTVHTSEEGIDSLRAAGLLVGLGCSIVIDNNHKIGGNHYSKTFLLWLIRSIRGLFTIPRLVASNPDLVIFTPANHWPDVLPAFVSRLLMRRNWVVGVWHFATPPMTRPGALLPNILFYAEDVLTTSLCRFAGIVLVQSNKQKSEVCRRLMVPSGKVLVVSGGVNAAEVDRIPPGHQSFDALFVSRLHPVKGIFDLIDIWAKVIAVQKTAKLGIIGASSEPEIVDKLQNKINFAGLQAAVTILGRVSEREKYSLMKNTRILIHPSYEDGTPLVFYEAMYCGMQVATYYLPTYRDLKHFIHPCKLGSKDELAETVIRLLEMPTSGESAATRKFALDHDWTALSLLIANSFS